MITILKAIPDGIKLLFQGVRSLNTVHGKAARFYSCLKIRLNDVRVAVSAVDYGAFWEWTVRVLKRFSRDF